MDRDALSGVEKSILALAASVPSFGGTWIDQAAGGVIHIGLTDNSSAVQALFTPAIPTGVQVSFDQVEFTKAQIMAAYSVINQTIAGNKSLRDWFIEAAVETEANRVRLALLNTVPQAVVDQFSAILSQANSRDMVDIVRSNGGRLSTEDAASSHNSHASSTGSRTSKSSSPVDAAAAATSGPRDRASGRLYGGEWITRIGPVDSCTAGFSDAKGKSSGNTYSVTAGHCYYSGTTWYQGHTTLGAKIGGVQMLGYKPGGSSYCDCMLTGPLGAGLATHYVIDPDGNSSGTYGYTRTASESDYEQGSKACLSGATYGDAHNNAIICGTVVNEYQTATYDDDYTLINAVTTTISASADGDSGGPYGDGGAFLGIHAGALKRGQEGVTLSRVSVFSRSTNLSLLNVTLSYA